MSWRSDVYPYFLTRVLRTRRVTPHLVRITVGGEGLEVFPRQAPDQWVKLFFPRHRGQEPVVPRPEGADIPGWYRRYLALPDEIRPIMRTFTVRAHRPGRAELDLEFVSHGDSGPASRWADAAAPGDPLGVMAGPSAFAPPEAAPWLLLAGDHAALPALATILESLDAKTQGLVLVELDDPADAQRLPAPPGARPRFVHRRSPAIPPGETLLETLRDTAFRPGTPYVWLAGEAGLVRNVRPHLTGRGVPKSAITFVGYWRRGKAESDAYTEDELAEARSS